MRREVVDILVDMPMTWHDIATVGFVSGRLDFDSACYLIRRGETKYANPPRQVIEFYVDGLRPGQVADVLEMLDEDWR